MADLDFGMAMVAARIASSEGGKDREPRNKGERKGPLPGARKRSSLGEPSLPGVKMEVINGELSLLPSVGLPRHSLAKERQLAGKDGSVIRIDMGKVLRPPEGRENRGPR